MNMKKIIISMFVVMLSMCAYAQNSNVELGKKYFTAELYTKALPYLQKAVEAGDIDSKVRLAYMIFTAQVPDYSIDQDQALQMLDECIEKGSVYALERKGFCIIAMSPDTKEDKLKGVDCLVQASAKGNGDASAELFKAYQEGIKSYATGEFYLEPNDSIATSYVKLAAQQGNQEGKAYMGLYTYTGEHGFTQDAKAGVKLMEEALAMSTRFFTCNCLEPARALTSYYKENGQTAKAAPIIALLKKYHPTEMQ
jgi:TPR repeat protein